MSQIFCARHDTLHQAVDTIISTYHLQVRWHCWDGRIGRPAGGVHRCSFAQMSLRWRPVRISQVQFKLYLSKLKIAFVQIAKCICSDEIQVAPGEDHQKWTIERVSKIAFYTHLRTWMPSLLRVEIVPLSLCFVPVWQILTTFDFWLWTPLCRMIMYCKPF